MRLPKWLACVGCLFACAACRADAINYSFNGSTCSPFPFGGCYPVTFDFQISSTAVPEISGTTSYGLPFFDFGSDQVTYLPSNNNFAEGNVVFASDSFGFSATVGSDYIYPGITFQPDTFAPLYSGSVTYPTLLTGDFGPAGGEVDGADDGFSGTLVVTDIPSSVAPTPEPASLLLLGTGACALFGVGRRRWMQGHDQG